MKSLSIMTPAGLRNITADTLLVALASTYLRKLEAEAARKAALDIAERFGIITLSDDMSYPVDTTIRFALDIGNEQGADGDEMFMFTVNVEAVHADNLEAEGYRFVDSDPPSSEDDEDDGLNNL